jgi:hypothetical protein
MDLLAGPAKAATAHRAGVSFTSIGVEVEEPLFLDEDGGHDVAPRDADRPSPFDLFADENDLQPPSPAPPAAPAPAPVATPPARDAAGRSAASRPTSISTPATMPAPVKPTVAAPELFNTYSRSNTGRVSLVAAFVLIATTTMLVAGQACQVIGGPRTASLAPPRP